MARGPESALSAGNERSRYAPRSGAGEHRKAVVLKTTSLQRTGSQGSVLRPMPEPTSHTVVVK